jgi:hypothetical protein
MGYQVNSKSAMELLTFRVTAPSTTLTAVTMNTDNSNIVRDFTPPNNAYIMTIWGKHQTAGRIQVKSPNLHEATRGITVFDTAANPDVLLPRIGMNPLTRNDQLSILMDGSGTGGDIELGALLVFYDSLPNISGRLIDADELRAAGGQEVAIENTLSLDTSGNYSGQEAINAEYDILKPDKDYALLGGTVSALCLAIRYRGIDTGGLGVGFPGNPTLKSMTTEWFVWLSEIIREKTGKPGKTIPVISGINKSQFFIDGVQDENGTDVTVETMFQQLN